MNSYVIVMENNPEYKGVDVYLTGFDTKPYFGKLDKALELPFDTAEEFLFGCPTDVVGFNRPRIIPDPRTSPLHSPQSKDPDRWMNHSNEKPTASPATKQDQCEEVADESRSRKIVNDLLQLWGSLQTNQSLVLRPPQRCGVYYQTLPDGSALLSLVGPKQIPRTVVSSTATPQAQSPQEYTPGSFEKYVDHWYSVWTSSAQQLEHKEKSQP